MLNAMLNLQTGMLGTTVQDSEEDGPRPGLQIRCKKIAYRDSRDRGDGLIYFLQNGSRWILSIKIGKRTLREQIHIAAISRRKEKNHLYLPSRRFLV